MSNYGGVLRPRIAGSLYEPLPSGPFDVIYADPPWYIGTPDRIRRGTVVEDHYSMLSVSELSLLPVADISNDPSVLFLWVIQSKLTDCISVAESWGFTYSTIAYVWHKQLQNLGYYTHPSVEICLLFRRGKIRRMPERVSVTEKQFISERKGKHSVKPGSVRESIKRLWPTARRIELFSRNESPGYVTWGNEAPLSGTESWWGEAIKERKRNWNK